MRPIVLAGMLLAAGCGEVTGAGTGSIHLGGSSGIDFLAPDTIALTAATPVDEVALADFDGDGHVDVVATAASNGRGYQLARGAGNGQFQPAASGPQLGFGPAPGDFNNDGVMDFLVASSGVDTLLGSSAGVLGFTDKHFNLPVSGAASGVLVADFDASGTLDVAVSVAPSVAVLLNGGATHTVGVPSPGQLVAADLNGDERIDIVAGGATPAGSPALVILLNAGQGSFTSSHSYEVAAAGSFAAGDVNGDGKVDLVVSAPANSLATLLGNGDGTFPAVGRTYSSGLDAAPGAMQLVDVDGDGGLDLLALDGAGGRLTALRGHGDGTFDAPLQFTVATTSPVRAQTMAVGDVDGDGHPDVVVATGAGFAVLLNAAP